MHCQNCNKEIPDNVKVCGYCGTKTEKNAMIPCPSCGKVIPAKAKVCGYCGTNLINIVDHKPTKVVEAKEEQPLKTKEKTPRQKTKKRKPEIKKKTNAKIPEDKKPRNQKAIAAMEKKPTQAKQKIPIWGFVAGAALVLAAGGYFLFFQSDQSPDCLNGNWAGNVYLDGEKIFRIYFDVEKKCISQAYCGEFSIPTFDVSGRIKIIDVKGSKFYFFAEPNQGKPESETPTEYLQCNKDGTLFYESIQDQGNTIVSGSLDRY